MQKTIPIENTAQGYLELLRDRGVKYFFGNAGTDFASLIDCFAKFAQENIYLPGCLFNPVTKVTGKQLRAVYKKLFGPVCHLTPPPPSS